MEFLISWILNSVFFILISSFILAYFYMTRNFKYWKKKGVTEISPFPFVGNFGKYFKYQESPGRLLKTLYDQSEGLPYVGIYILDQPCLLLRDPEIIKRILIKDFNSFSDKLSRSSKHDIISNSSLFFIGNPHWKYIREKFTSLFTTVKMKRIFNNVHEIGKDLNHCLESFQLEDSEKEINIKVIADKFAIDLFGITAFGLKLNSLNNPESEFRKFGKTVVGNYTARRVIEVAIIWLAPQFATLFGCRLFLERTCNFFRKTFQDILNHRITTKAKQNDFIDLMIQLQNSEENDSGFSLKDDILLSQMMTFFVAGFEASSALLTYTFFELAKHPEIQTKLRNEINTAIEKNDGKITYEMVTEMQYLDSIVSESLRKYPSLPIIDRRATVDYTIEETGLVIEKGTPIIVPMLGLHFDPKYFPDPKTFDPERFSSHQKSLRNPYVYLPFGIGIRNCIGMRQGLLQSKIGILCVIAKFELSLSKNTEVELNNLSIFNSCKGNLFLKIRKIDANRKNE